MASNKFIKTQSQGIIHVFSDAPSLIKAASEHFIALANASIKTRGIFCVALSGGNTPKPLYATLGNANNQKQLDWSRIHLFWGDERHVPPDHPNSNYHMVEEHLIKQVPLPDENIHRVPAEMEIRMAAFRYEETLRSFFSEPWPHFDLVLLGMGEDGHTASLFPRSAGLNEDHRWFIANEATGQSGWRLTLSKHAINAARNIAVLVYGKSKAPMFAEVIQGKHEPINKPIQFITPLDGEMVWFVDEEAARQLSWDLDRG